LSLRAKAASEAWRASEVPKVPRGSLWEIPWDNLVFNDGIATPPRILAGRNDIKKRQPIKRISVIGVKNVYNRVYALREQGRSGKDRQGGRRGKTRGLRQYFPHHVHLPLEGEG